MSDDIVDAIARFRVAFLRENMEPPMAIYLSTHKEGMRFLSYMCGSNFWTTMVGDPRLGQPVETADGIYMEVEIMGMKVRWPAQRIALPSGGFKYA
jgi:hypothetical protein